MRDVILSVVLMKAINGGRTGIIAIIIILFH